MANVFDSNLSGNLSRRTLIIYKLDPTGTIPIEPILDLVPGVTINRITADLIESENYSVGFETTDVTVSNFSTRTINSRQTLQLLSVSVLFTDLIQPGISTAISPIVATPDQIRADLIRIRNLIKLAGEGQPVAVYTPRWALPRAFITDVSCPWSPAEGTNTRASISFKEAKIARPKKGKYVQDFELQAGGAQEATGGGQSVSGDQAVSSFSDGAVSANAPIVS